MRVLVLAVAVLLAACATPPPVIGPTPSPTREPNVLHVSALLDLSGTREPLGAAQRNAMQLWLDQAQQRAPGTVRIRVKFVDVAGSDTRLLIELRRAVIDDRADTVVIGAPVVPDDTLTSAAALAAVPILLTLPTQDITSAGGGWLFGLAPTVGEVAAVLVADMIERRVATPAVAVSDGSHAAAVEQQALLAALGDRAQPRPDVIALTDPGGPERVRLSATSSRSVTLAGPASAYAEVLRAIRADATRGLYLSYLTELADVATARGSGMSVRWPGSRRVVGTAPAGSDRLSFIQGFTDRHGAPSTAAGSAYDALALIDAAAEQAPGELDPARLRQRLETRTFAGIVTQYTFSVTRHAGFDPRDIVMLTSDARGLPGLAPSPSPSPSPSPPPSPSPTSSP